MKTTITVSVDYEIIKKLRNLGLRHGILSKVCNESLGKYLDDLMLGDKH
jgi:hypothetical protein